MAVPSAMTDLTVDESTNVPADSETVTPALRPSDYLRSHAAIMRRPFAKGADVASATAANLGSNTDGDYFHITGTTGLAASNFGTVAAGIERTIVFDGALLLTHNATSFILPGGANITTAAGDVAVFRSEASGNWKCTSYVKASGAPVGSYQPLDATLTALASALTAANKIPYATATDTLGELTRSTDGTLAGNSDTNMPTEKAVKTYSDTKNIATQVTPGTSGNVLTSNGSAWTSAALPASGAFTKEYASTAQTITLGGLLTLAHGLSSAPKLVYVQLKCTDAGGDAGWAQNDIIECGVSFQQQNSGGGHSIYCDATNINIRMSSGAYQAHNKSTGAPSNLATAKWALLITAYA